MTGLEFPLATVLEVAVLSGFEVRRRVRADPSRDGASPRDAPDRDIRPLTRPDDPLVRVLLAELARRPPLILGLSRRVSNRFPCQEGLRLPVFLQVRQGVVRELGGRESYADDQARREGLELRREEVVVKVYDLAVGKLAQAEALGIPLLPQFEGRRLPRRATYRETFLLARRGSRSFRGSRPPASLGDALLDESREPRGRDRDGRPEGDQSLLDVEEPPGRLRRPPFEFLASLRVGVRQSRPGLLEVFEFPQTEFDDPGLPLEVENDPTAFPRVLRDPRYVVLVKSLAGLDSRPGRSPRSRGGGRG